MALDELQRLNSAFQVWVSQLNRSLYTSKGTNTQSAPRATFPATGSTEAGKDCANPLQEMQPLTQRDLLSQHKI